MGIFSPIASSFPRRDARKIRELVAQGKSLPEIKKELGEPLAPPADANPAFLSFTDVVYKEFTKAYPPSLSPAAGTIQLTCPFDQ